MSGQCPVWSDRWASERSWARHLTLNCLVCLLHILLNANDTLIEAKITPLFYMHSPPKTLNLTATSFWMMDRSNRVHFNIACDITTRLTDGSWRSDSFKSRSGLHADGKYENMLQFIRVELSRGSRAWNDLRGSIWTSAINKQHVMRLCSGAV